MVVGDPIPPPVPAEGASRVSRRAIKETTDRLYADIQRLYDEACELAGRPNPPRPVTPGADSATA